VQLAVNDGSAEPVLPADNDRRSNPVTVALSTGPTCSGARVTVHGPGGGLTTVAIDLSAWNPVWRALIWSQAGIEPQCCWCSAWSGIWWCTAVCGPLVEVERTAFAIAGGELDRRGPAT
jgi:two-component system OmpR family sensor kinase